MLEQKEFTIQSCKDLTFRLAKFSIIELLAIKTMIDFNDFNKTKMLFEFALTHIEVKIENSWFLVKAANKEFYTPATIETNIQALEELVSWFLNNVIKPTFTKSSESN